jgi:3-methyladenine DNA glycosylase/8-oxoguanine DNA glycosylase
MPPPLAYAEAARRHLRRRDPALRAVLERVGPFALRLERNRFAALAWSIISQQISVRAAASIRRRLADLVAPRRLTPEVIASLPLRKLRRAGLSRAKAASLHDLAAKVTAGVVNLRGLHRVDDEAVIEQLIQVKGIGRWTAEMFLIFALGRPDVLPVDDLGLRAGIQRLDGLDELPSKAEVIARGAVWQPYRSVATWYLWQSLKQPALQGRVPGGRALRGGAPERG